MKTSDFIKVVTSLAFENAFNPYAETCNVHDCKGAADLRRSTLANILDKAVCMEVGSIWIGRDLGHRGGRRTGMALTDDVHLAHHAARWGVSARRPTRGIPVAERTAAMVWNILGSITEPIFLWNVFPLHPHEPGQPFTNRAHTARERDAGEEVLSLLVTLLRPRLLIAIGNDAAASATRVASGCKIAQVRHPSYGGHKDFVAGLRSIYNLRESDQQLALL